MNDDLQKVKMARAIFRYAPLFFCNGLGNFISSTTQASMSNTSRFIRPLTSVFFFPNAPEETLIVYHSYIHANSLILPDSRF